MASASEHGASEEQPAGDDRADAAVWLTLGSAALAASLVMDRLENQDVPAYTAPGLLPGLLSLLMLVLGATLLVRGRQRARAHSHSTLTLGVLGPAPGRALLAIGLCVLFGTVLVGHGLPFWAAAASFVAACIFLLRPAGGDERRRSGVRDAATAALTGLGAGLVITAVFQWVFFVRLP